MDSAAKAVSAGCAIFSHEFKGAASRVPVEATAFGLRRNHVMIEILASFPDRADGLEERRHQQWVRDTRRAFDAIALPGGYPNLLASGDTDRASESFGPNAGRLARVKQLYDPENVFCSAIPLPLGRRDRGVNKNDRFVMNGYCFAQTHDLQLDCLLPGIFINTSSTNFVAVSQFQLMRFEGDRWVRFGRVIRAM